MSTGLEEFPGGAGAGREEPFGEKARLGGGIRSLSGRGGALLRGGVDALAGGTGGAPRLDILDKSGSRTLLSWLPGLRYQINEAVYFDQKTNVEL